MPACCVPHTLLTQCPVRQEQVASERGLPLWRPQRRQVHHEGGGSGGGNHEPPAHGREGPQQLRAQDAPGMGGLQK